MTTLLLLEKCRPDELVVAPPDVASVKEASLNLKPGEGVRVKNLAYALMLRSANDGCYSVAKHIAGSNAAFADIMNARAVEIGCRNTHFANPHGLHNSEHYTTPYDLCLMGREAMQREDFREIVRTKRKVIDRSMNFKDRLMENHNKILWLDPSADGIKTGFTNPAGHTYVGSATRDGMRIIDSLMFAPKWKDDHKQMLNWAFSEYEVKIAQLRGMLPDEMVRAVGLTCGVELRENAYACVHRTGDLIETNIELGGAKRPFRAGDEVGFLVVKDKDGFVQRHPIFATSDEPVATSAAATAGGSSRLLEVGLGAFAFGAITYGLTRFRARKQAARELAPGEPAHS